MQNLSVVQAVILGGLFIFVAGGVLVAMLLFAPRSIQRRLQQAGGAGAGTGAVAGTGDGEGLASQWVAKLVELSSPISKLSVPKDGWENSPLRIRLMNAGWREQSAAALYFTAKTVLALGLPCVALLALIPTELGDERVLLSAILVMLAGIGYYIPNIVLSQRVKVRQLKIFEDFPDALDLLTVCVEAGLGLDAALMKVSEELRFRSEVVASELDLLLLEMRSGFTKETALRNLALRTGVEDIESFCAMLIQADRFGTSISESLRVLSDMLRTRRRMRAEERAAKIALKLLFPLIFCIFPALMLVLLGPAMIHVYRVLLPTFVGISQ
ncbi:type II secretion system F family protein [Burkholderia stabilis]|uniref:Flp pilus assembly protein TadB,Bacterial type II secretion system protein F domain n=1 Tax=Burkholderia stabilis TaxID=95485 RepID=A0AAJ5NJ90_9BURK|nr:type II secretion system F family protein [Burkholderia stabilis]VBB16600.1 Flp pilus assembly protein TadB,Bacterial type II secretion system protein F domain [Burkholderia stabilis]HDR9586664.1 type II secretion system F family protein [Burkholderia stabilis]HDR9650245.1 type II secretion system F family protein [Burkholderia stabilis]HDR9680163.1 type II secretion system F family protein [Burkholderia stabilis]